MQYMWAENMPEIALLPNSEFSQEIRDQFAGDSPTIHPSSERRSLPIPSLLSWII